MLDRAIARGEIPAGTDREVILDLLFGAAQHRLLLGHLPLTDSFVREVVEVIVAVADRLPLMSPTPSTCLAGMVMAPRGAPEPREGRWLGVCGGVGVRWRFGRGLWCRWDLGRIAGGLGSVLSGVGGGA